MNSTILNDIMNGYSCNEPKRFQCIIRNLENDDYDQYLLLTTEQIRIVQYLLAEEVINDVYTLVVLDEESKTFKKV